LRSFPTSRKACTGGRMSDGVAFTMWPKSDQTLAWWALWNDWAADHPGPS